MDHWRLNTAQGPVSQYTSRTLLDQCIRQIAAVGFQGIETFTFNLAIVVEMFGSLANFNEFLQSRGLQKLVNLFFAQMYDNRIAAPHVRSTHDYLFNAVERSMQAAQGNGIENIIVMPAALYISMEPVTDDKILACIELWERVGRMTLDYGVKLACHHEFFCGIRSREELEKFYAWSDPRYVHFYCDTAQHVIAGVDPIELYRKLRDRCSGFHFKDTRHVDTAGDYRRPPDAELMAPTTDRWFYEAGTPGGLVDFPAMMRAMKDCGYRGWVSVEHDKAQIGGGNFAETTCLAKWYIDRVLTSIYS